MVDLKQRKIHSTDALLLVIAYKRFENVKRIMEVAREAHVSRILIQIDEANHDDLLTNQKQEKFRNEINGYLGMEVEVVTTKTNSGCAVNVLSAIDLAFTRSEFCFILEDDCIPTSDFFRFALESQVILNANDDIWLTCGTQIAPVELTNGYSVCSNYALTWGWYTDLKNWLAIREALFSTELGEWEGVKLREKVYWKAGRKRAKDGVTDVWDTILVSRMRELGKKSLLPPVCLVTNIGDDEVATHTIPGSSWLHKETGSFKPPIKIAEKADSEKIDAWLFTNLFQISYKHLLSTLITRLLDFVSLRKRKYKTPLVDRLGWE